MFLKKKVFCQVLEMVNGKRRFILWFFEQNVQNKFLQKGFRNMFLKRFIKGLKKVPERALFKPTRRAQQRRTDGGKGPIRPSPPQSSPESTHPQRHAGIGHGTW